MAEEPGQQAGAFDAAAFIASLSPENKDFVTAKGFIKTEGDKVSFDANAPFDSYRNAEKMVGVDVIPSPRLDDEKAWAEWPGHAKLGVPAKAEDYKFERPKLPDGLKWKDEDAQNGIEWDKASEDTIRAAAKKWNVGQKQAAGMFGELAAMRIGEIGRNIASANEVKMATDKALRAEYGAAYDDTIKGAQLAWKFVAEKIGADENAVADGVARMVGDASAVKLFAWLAKSLGNDTLGGGNDQGFKDGPASAREEISRLKTDTDFQAAWTDASHAGHKDAVARMERLNKIAYS